MKGVLFLALPTLALLLAETVVGQELGQSVPLPRPKDWEQTDLPTAAIAGTVICESTSGIYLRLLQAKQLWTQAPFRILQLDGKSIEIDPTTATTPPGPVIATAYDVDLNGNLYATIQVGRSAQWYVASFDKSGHFTGKTALSETFNPSFILPISKGRFVIGGVKPKTTAEQMHTSSLVAIFDPSGNVLKSLSLPDDDAEEEVTKQVVPNHIFYSVYNRAIEMGRAVLGPDGNIYIFRAFSQPKVQILDPEGNLLRVTSLVPSASGSWPTNFYVFGDSIAVGYLMSKREDVCLTEGNFTLYSPVSGRILHNYLIPLGPQLFVCAQNHSLVYLNAAHGDTHYQVGRIVIPADSGGQLP